MTVGRDGGGADQGGGEGLEGEGRHFFGDFLVKSFQKMLDILMIMLIRGSKGC